jgi:hypothetical protein
MTPLENPQQWGFSFVYDREISLSFLRFGKLVVFSV